MKSIMLSSSIAGKKLSQECHPRVAPVPTAPSVAEIYICLHAGLEKTHLASAIR